VITTQPRLLVQRAHASRITGAANLDGAGAIADR